MLANSAAESLDQLGPRSLEAPARELGELGRFSRAVDQGVEDGPATLAENVADDAGQLDVRVFERLLDALRVTRSLLTSCLRVRMSARRS